MSETTLIFEAITNGLLWSLDSYIYYYGIGMLNESGLVAFEALLALSED